MTPFHSHVVRLVQRRGTFCSDAQLRWLFLSILCLGLAFTLHASGREKSVAAGLADTQPRVMTIASAAPWANAPADTAARVDTVRASRRDEGSRPAAPGRTQRRTRLRAYSEDQVQNLIRGYAETLGLDPEIPLAIARCESQFQWDAANRGSSARGVFQYVKNTWRRTPEGKRGTSVLDADANVRMALTHMATVGTTPWKASRACWSAGRPGASVERVASAEASSEPPSEPVSASATQSVSTSAADSDREPGASED